MKKLLISLMVLSTIPALTMGSAVQQRRAAMLAAQQAKAGQHEQKPVAPVGVQTPVGAQAPVGVQTPANNPGLNAVLAQIQKVLNNASNATFTTRKHNLEQLVTTLEQQNAPVVSLSTAEQNTVLAGLNAIWKEANDLIALCENSYSAFNPFNGMEDKTVNELKNLKFKIAERAKTLTGSMFQLGYTIPAYIDNYWKKTSTIAALTLWATYRLGLGSKAGNAVPKALSMGWDLAKWIAVGSSTVTAPEAVRVVAPEVAPATKSLFARFIEAMPTPAE